MRICFTTDTIHRGGKERQLFILSKYLSKKKNDISIISFNKTAENYINEYKFDINQLYVINKKQIFRKYKKFKTYIQSIKPDMVFSWDLQSAFFALILHKKYDFYFINGSIQHGIRLWRFSHLFRSLICWLSPYIIANSYAGLSVNNLKPGKKRFVLYNGIEKKFQNTSSQKSLEKSKEEIIPGYAKIPGKIFISVANLVPYKDYFTVLSALKEIRNSYNFYYLILGDGPLRNEIEQKINDFHFTDNVILYGKVNDVNKYLNISDYMIHSSRGEGFSNAILEGMYAGLPIITTKVGGTPEIVFPKSSVFFKYKDENSLTNILLNIDNYFLEFNPKSKEYQNHLKKFSVSAMLTSFEKIIESVMK